MANDNRNPGQQAGQARQDQQQDEQSRRRKAKNPTELNCDPQPGDPVTNDSDEQRQGTQRR